MKKIQEPETQEQEVLFELINRLTIDRRSMMLSCGVWNLPENIRKLRNKGVNIKSNKVTCENKFGRKIDFVHYSCEDKKEAVKIYEMLKLTQDKKLSIYERMKPSHETKIS